MAAILVGMADLKVAKAPDSLTTLGLGSCVGICLFDATRKIGGMAHIMLPYSGNTPGNRMKFADTGIVDLIDLLIRAGASRPALIAKLAGGAHMFGFEKSGGVLNVGERNVEASTLILNHLKIPIRASDTGGKHGRTIELDAATGALRIKTVGYGESFI